jgi:signal transduction histidine kinase/DNA-binding response OmpR family regulator
MAIARREQSHNVSKSSLSVLLVDDSSYWTDTIGAWLKDAGHSVEVRHDGLAAVEALRNRPPDVLVTDYFLATLDGGKLCQLAKAAKSSTTTVILTGGADGRLTRSPPKHADAVIAKREPEAVFDALERALRSGHTASTPSAPVEDEAEERTLSEKLHGLKQYLDALHEGIGDAVLQVDAQLRLTFVNSTAEELLDIDGHGAIGEALHTVLGIARDHDLVERVQSVLSGTMRAERPLTVSVGDNLFRATVAGLSSPDGRATALIIAQDISDLVEAERSRVALNQRLHESDKMASLGHLVAGVCHEINNPLAAVMMNLDSLATMVQTLPRDATGRPNPVEDQEVAVREILGVIEETSEAAQRLRTVVSDMRHFSRKGERRGQRTRVEQIMDDVLALVASEARHRARIERIYGDTPELVVDRARLSHAFLNVVLNAIQAIEKNRPEAHWIRVETRTEGDGVSISIQNSGAPIPQESQARVFEPFFTTKPTGEGVGLGLSITYETVRGHGGYIEVESDSSTPTTFRIWLPRDTGLGIGGHPSEPAPAPRRVASVLVVDDDKFFRNSLRRTLEHYFDVTIAPSGPRALQLMESHDFDVVVCDLIMPKMTGMEVYEAVRQRSPVQASRFLFLTGGTDTAEARNFLLQVDNPRAYKPIRGNELVNLVSRSLENLGDAEATGPR